MNKSILLFIVLLFQFAICYSQTDEQKKFLQEPLEGKILTEKQVDTFLKYNVRSNFYSKDYAKTIDFGTAIIKQANKINYNSAAYKASSILSNAFIQLNDTLSAVKIIEKQLEIAQVKKDSSIFLGASIDLANIYVIQGNKDKAIKSYKEVMPYAKSLNEKISMFILNHNIAELYLDKKDIEKAKPYVREADIYVENLNSTYYHIGNTLILGRLNYLENRSKDAIVQFKKVIELAKKVKYTDALIDGYQYYTLCEAKLGNYKKAYSLQQQVDFYKSEKYSKDKIAAIENESAKFKLKEFEQEIRENELQKQFIEEKASRSKKIMLWLIVGSTVLLLSFGLLFVSYRNRKKLLLDLEEKNKKYLIAKEESEAYAIAKSTFFSNISHELRTPLYGIIGISSILMDDENINENHKEDVKSLKFSADYLLSLINDVLQISKLDAKQETSLNKISFNLKDLVYGIMKSFEFLKAQNMNTFEINFSENTPDIIIGDDVKLSQILINLIGNACKFTENGRISLSINAIETNDGTSQLYFKVKDTGIGIPENKQSVIFDEFTQVESETGEYQGTGLGLPIVKKLITLHDSEINLVSKEGEGTEIGFALNFKVDKNNDSSKEIINQQSKISIKGKSILVVDDNRINRIVTRKILEKYKSNPLIAEGGEKAIEMAKENKIDLILMDINMPGIDGLQATEGIRKFNTSVPIIALTAVEIEEMRESIKNSTICDIIIKPYDEIVFVETILKHIK